MTWTYGGDPAASNRDWIRSATGDVVATATLSLTDEEIAAELTERGDKKLAAAHCAQRLAARAARIVTSSHGSGNRSDLARQLNELADRLFAEASGGMTWEIGGTSVADKDALDDDDDVPERAFQIGMDDHPDLSGATNEDDA